MLIRSVLADTSSTRLVFTRLHVGSPLLGGLRLEGDVTLSFDAAEDLAADSMWRRRDPGGQVTMKLLGIHFDDVSFAPVYSLGLLEVGLSF